MDRDFNLEPKKLRLYQIKKYIAAKIAPHIYSALRDLGVIFENIYLSSIPKLVYADPAGTLDS